MTGGSWPSSLLLPSSPTPWMRRVLASTRLLHHISVPRTHFCLFYPPCKYMPVAKGSTVPTQIRAASQSSKCLKPAVLRSTWVLQSWRARQNTRWTDLLQAHLHNAHNPHVQTDISSLRGMQIHPSLRPFPPPMHLLILHTRLHLPVWMLLRLTSGQHHQQPCPFPCSASARHWSPDHSTAADISWRWIWNGSSSPYLTHPGQTNGTSWQRRKPRAVGLERQSLGRSMGDALYLPELNITSCIIIFRKLQVRKAELFPTEGKCRENSPEH